MYATGGAPAASGGGSADHGNQRGKGRQNNRKFIKAKRKKQAGKDAPCEDTDQGNLALGKDAEDRDTISPQRQISAELSSGDAPVSRNPNKAQDKKDKKKMKKNKKKVEKQNQVEAATAAAVSAAVHGVASENVNVLNDHQLELGNNAGRRPAASKSQDRQNFQKASEDNRNRNVPCEPMDSAMEAEVKELETEFLFRLKKKSLKFPGAKFFCRLCDYHCDTVLICRKHIQDTRHQRLKTIKTNDMLLRNLPPPTVSHCASLSRLLEAVVEERALTKQQLKERLQAFNTIKAIVKAGIPGVEMSLYGSTVSGFGLKDSDLNIDITMATSPLILKDVYVVLLKDQSGYLSNVLSDFTSKVPVVKVHIPSLGVQCQIGINNSGAVQTSQLLALYTQIDPRVAKLGIIFKYWAKLCKIDQQSTGTLPSYAFTLMAVQFLQKQVPILPILHEIFTKELVAEKNKPGGENVHFSDLKNLSKHWQPKECTADLGSLWIQLLKYYIMDFDLQTHVVCIRQRAPLSRQAKKWASKKVAIEDPFMRRRNVARSLSHPRLFEYINDRIRATYKYYAIPQTKNGPLFEDIDPKLLQRKLQDYMRLQQDKAERDGSRDHSPASRDAARSKEGSRQPSQTASPGSEATDRQPSQDLKDAAASSASTAAMPSSSASTAARLSSSACTAAEPSSSASTAAKAAIDSVLASLDGLDITPDKSTAEDADAAATDAAAAASDGATSEASDGAVAQPGEDAVEQFVCKLVESVIKESVRRLSEEAGVAVVADTDAAKACVDDTDSATAAEAGEGGPEEVKDAEDEEEEEEEDEETTENSEDEDTAGKVSDLGPEAGGSQERPLVVANGDVKNDVLMDDSMVSVVRTDDLVFKFDEMTLTDGQGPALMCSICQREGHLKQNCPEEILPEVLPLPVMTPQYQATLDRILQQVPKDFEPTPREVQIRSEVVQELEGFVRTFYEDAELSLFGSSCNGFGFRESDLDICMTFSSQPTPEGLNCVEIIETLAHKLKKHKSFFNVFAITTAKVPIVKFKHRRSQLEGDVSLYNTLAQHNTRMLNMYSLIDYRVKILGYTMKVFAKICDICDASRGSLSSYAYTLMVLYYLQQRSPPVIPVLQELYVGQKPEVIVDQWNAWFYGDLEALPQVWPGYGQNNESPAQLWVGLLCFYSEQFNFNDCVASMRQHQLLTKFEKLWNGKCVAIEDPFDLGHNLGVGLSRKMNTYIQRTFRCGRRVFGTPIDRPPQAYHTMQDYLFDPELLADGHPPNDRGCRICGKIGHIAKECPIVQARKVRQERERDEKRRHREQEHGARELPSNHGNHGNRSGRDAHVHASAPRHIPQAAYERSHSRGQTPPDYGGGGMGRSPRASNQGTYQRSYNTPPRNIPPQGTPPRQGGRVVNTQIFHSTQQQMAGFQQQQQQQQQQPISPSQLQRHHGNQAQGAARVIYINPQMVNMPQLRPSPDRLDLAQAAVPQIQRQHLASTANSWHQPQMVLYEQPQPQPLMQGGAGNHGSRVADPQQYSRSPGRHSNTEGSEPYRDQQGQAGRHRNQHGNHGNQVSYHGNQHSYQHGNQHNYPVRVQQQSSDGGFNQSWTGGSGSPRQGPR